MRFIDSHTGGEPTRVIFAGLPEIPGATVAEKRDSMAARFDWIRTASVCEPRGSEVLVGAVLVEPSDPVASFGVIFFNTDGYLGMCGHGTIGVVETLRHLGWLNSDKFSIETPVGLVEVAIDADGKVSFVNIECYVYRTGVRIGDVSGDIAYGGNWFFLCEDHGRELSLSGVGELTEFTSRIMDELAANGITGEGGARIDHVELFGPAQHGGDSQNFVLCPGKAYDRSPCGTGTSAKMASLHAKGKVEVGQIWQQESITGSIFEASIAEVTERGVRPRISGQAFVTAVGELIFTEGDPFLYGIGVSESLTGRTSQTSPTLQGGV